MIYYYQATAVEDPEEEESPTDTSEDSIEVAVRPVTTMRNKRKSLEPRRFRIHKIEDATDGCESPQADYNKNNEKRRRPSSPCQLAPKKRFKLEALLDLEAAAAESRLQQLPSREETSVTAAAAAPFRPWAAGGTAESVSPSPLRISEKYLSMMQSLVPVEPEQDEPLALVVKKERLLEVKPEPAVDLSRTSATTYFSPQSSPPRAPVLPNARHQTSMGSKSPAEGRKQTNYKSLTKDRRVEANARERQRVHTITAAFETLQAAIPSEDENAKLSKLSVIKIATAYIMALSRMAGYDYTEDQSAPSLETVIQHCQEVIHTETRMKSRKC
jgi:hypothetical protein